jgi:hypothetical protein
MTNGSRPPFRLRYLLNPLYPIRRCRELGSAEEILRAAAGVPRYVRGLCRNAYYELRGLSGLLKARGQSAYYALRGLPRYVSARVQNGYYALRGSPRYASARVQNGYYALRGSPRYASARLQSGYYALRGSPQYVSARIENAYYALRGSSRRVWARIQNAYYEFRGLPGFLRARAEGLYYKADIPHYRSKLTGMLGLRPTPPLSSKTSLKFYSLKGASMQFLLRAGDLIIAKPVALEELRFGDLIVFDNPEDRSTDDKIVHRYLWSGRKNGQAHLRSRGDSLIFLDPPLPSGRLLGKAVLVYKNHGWVSLEGFRSRCLSLCMGLSSSLFFIFLGLANFLPRALLLGAYRFLGGRERGRFLEPLLRIADWHTRIFDVGIRNRLARLPNLLGLFFKRSRRSPFHAPGNGLKGTLQGVTSLEGEVRIGGNLFIPKGSMVTIKPGTRLIFEQPWSEDFAAWRPTPGGGRTLRPEAGSSWIVEGELRVPGEEERPVELTGKHFGGFFFLGRSKGEFRHVVWNSTPFSKGVVCWDFARVTLNRCRMTRSSGAADVGERARLRLEDCAFEKLDNGVTASGTARLIIKNCEFKTIHEAALRLTDRSAARSSGCSVVRCGAGVELGERSRWSSRRDRLSDCEGPGVALKDGAELTLTDGSINRNQVGLLAESGRSALDRVEMISNRDVGMDLTEGVHRGEKITIAKSPVGIGCHGGAELTLQDSMVQAQEIGLSATGASVVSCLALAFERTKTGLWCQERSRCTVLFSRFADNRDYAVRLSRRAKALLRGNFFFHNGVIALLAEEGAVVRAHANVFYGNPTAIKLDPASRSRIVGNTIRDARVDSVWQNNRHEVLFQRNRVENSRRVHEPRAG